MDGLGKPEHEGFRAFFLNLFMYPGGLDIDERIDLVALPDHLADCLRRAQARGVTVESNRVMFEGGLLRLVSRTNVLSPFGYGVVTVDVANRQVEYELSFLELVIAATVLVSLLALSMLRNSAPYTLAVVLLFWALSIGLNLGIGLVRFRSFIQRSIEAARNVSQ